MNHQARFHSYLPLFKRFIVPFLVACSPICLFSCESKPHQILSATGRLELPTEAQTDLTRDLTRGLPVEWSLKHDYVDLRGVGDTAWSTNHKDSPLDPETGNPAANAEKSEIGAELARFDPESRVLRGHLNFVNWESVVGEKCLEFFGNRFLFLSHPEAIVHTFQHGFNLFGATNNHTRDCHNKSEQGERASEALTAQSLESVLQDKNALWSGIGIHKDQQFLGGTHPRIREFEIHGKNVTVAMNAVHLGRSNCPLANCFDNVTEVLEKMRDVKADIKLLSIHSLEQGDKWTWIRKIGERFVRDFDGDIVFGHGPHVWKPLVVVKKKDEGYGVIFTSLGNFIHPGLVVQQNENAISRVLIDQSTKQIAEVQWLTVGTRKERVWFEKISALKMGVEGDLEGTILSEDRVEFATGTAQRGIVRLK